MKFSIVISVLNEPENLYHTLNSLFSVTNPDDLDVIVIDDHSTEPITLPPAHAKHCFLYRKNKSMGPGACRDFGAKIAANDRVIFTDAHMRFPKGWNNILADAVNQSRHCDVLTSRYLSLDPNNPDLNHPISEVDGCQFVFLDFYDGFWHLMDGPNLPTTVTNPIHPVPQMTGAFYCFNLQWYQTLGGTGGLTGWGGFEFLTSARTWLFGGSVNVVSDLKIGHIGQPVENRTAKHKILHNKLAVCMMLMGPEYPSRILDTMPKNDLKRKTLDLIEENQKIISNQFIHTLNNQIHSIDWLFNQFQLAPLEENLKILEQTKEVAHET